MRSQLDTKDFVLSLVICIAGCGAPAKPARTAAPTPAATTANVSTAPTVKKNSVLTDEAVLFVCGAKRTPGGLTSEAVTKEVAESDRDVSTGSVNLLKAAPAQCKDAADKLQTAFELQMAASRTLCDLRVARGIGISGAELDAETKELSSRIFASGREVAAGNAAVCGEKGAELTQDIASWRGLRDAWCAPTALQKQVLACGVDSSDAVKRADAMAYCDARTNGSGPAEDVVGRVTRCVLAAPPVPRGGERGLSSMDERGLTDAASGGLETSLLRGAAEFFETRAEQEATLFAYDVVGKHLCADDEMKALLKNTCELFAADETLAATPAAIREAVRADLERLPEVLVGKIADSF